MENIFEKNDRDANKIITKNSQILVPKNYFPVLKNNWTWLAVVIYTKLFSGKTDIVK